MVSSRANGFTLIETLLALGITSVVLLAASLLWTLAVRGQAQTAAVYEVESQGSAVLETIRRAAYTATQVQTPAAGIAGTTLVLPQRAGGTTTFDVSAGRIRMDVSGAVSDLTSARVDVSSWSVSNLTRSSTTGTARVTFTLTANGGSLFPSYARTFTTTVSLRP